MSSLVADLTRLCGCEGAGGGNLLWWTVCGGGCSKWSGEWELEQKVGAEWQHLEKRSGVEGGGSRVAAWAH